MLLCGQKKDERFNAFRALNKPKQIEQACGAKYNEKKGYGMLQVMDCSC